MTASGAGPEVTAGTPANAGALETAGATQDAGALERAGTQARRAPGAGRHTGTRARRTAGRPRRLSLSNWPVASRLVAVFAVASISGLVFGGLRVSDAVGAADAYGRTAQLASLGEQVTVLAQAVENERDLYTGVSAYTVLSADAGANKAAASVINPIKAKLAQANTDLSAAERKTDAAAKRTTSLASAIGAAFPANVQAKAETAVQTIGGIPAMRNALVGQSPSAIISTYSTSITELFALNDEITSGSGDPTLADDVRALGSLSRAKDQVSQQRAILYSAFLEATVDDAGGGKQAPSNTIGTHALDDAGGDSALTTAQGLQLAYLTNFDNAAPPALANTYLTTVAGQKTNNASLIENFVSQPSDPRLTFKDIGTNISLGFSRSTVAAKWYSDATTVIDQMRSVEGRLAATIVAHSQQLKQQAIDSAIVTAAVTAGAVLLVLFATVLVGRTLVNPLRRLQADALEIAMSRLPARVAAAASGTDTPEASAMIEPIGVQSTDEIGRVARAFDQVHAEAVRLAGTEAQLRGSLNAMFISLSRRSVPLIERLSRVIDSMEQSEDDPDQLANLFAMDHMVTRMRRNSENLLVLAGEEPVRKWTEPVPLADVARAAAAEIEQYNRVALAVQPGIMVSGQAAADVVHLFAELIENATLFSPQTTQVRVTVMELSSGGVLIEVRDDGVGISDSRLADMNWRLDHPPVVDVSISRHMGLYAVSRLAARHGIRVRLRPGTPQGLSALVWLPGHLAKNEPAPASGSRSRLADAGLGARLITPTRRDTGRHRNEPLSTGGDRAALSRRAAPAGRPGTVWFTAKRPSGGGVRPLDEVAAGWRPTENGHGAPVGPAATAQSGRTMSGLPKRVPGRTTYPGSDTPGGGMPTAAVAATAPLLGAPDAQQHEQALLRRRSPDSARSRLSGFQLGSRDAVETGQGTSWRQQAGEENDR
ncbi:MAG: nitrate- and nitrite sensing domain-containing protein [Trebonia sp.]